MLWLCFSCGSVFKIQGTLCFKGSMVSQIGHSIVMQTNLFTMRNINDEQLSSNKHTLWNSMCTLQYGKKIPIHINRNYWNIWNKGNPLLVSCIWTSKYCWVPYTDFSKKEGGFEALGTSHYSILKQYQWKSYTLYFFKVCLYFFWRSYSNR